MSAAETAGSQYIAAIKAAYEGELYGEAWFSTMARDATTQDRRRKLAAMSQLELQTRTRMTPLLARHGITGIDETAQRAKGMRLAQRHATMAWPDFVSWFFEEIGRFVTLYDEMARNSMAEDAAILSDLARHERALLDFARLEAEGSAERSLDPVLALLDESSRAQFSED